MSGRKQNPYFMPEASAEITKSATVCRSSVAVRDFFNKFASLRKSTLWLIEKQDIQVRELQKKGIRGKITQLLNKRKPDL